MMEFIHILRTFLLFYLIKLGVALSGGGANTAAEWMHQQFTTFTQKHQTVTELTYRRTGSTTGRAWIKGKKEPREEFPPIVFAGSDSPLTDEDYEKYPNLQMFPLVGSAVVIVYNLPGIESLTLSLEMAARVYDGSITHWNDSSLKLSNPKITLPDEEIITVARRDGSGNTKIFTTGLSSANDWWNQNVGSFSKPKLIKPNGPSESWPNEGPTHYGFNGLACGGLIKSVPYSIGYLALADAKLWDFKPATLVTSIGEAIDESKIEEGVVAAMEYYAENISNRLTVDIVGAPAENAYPLATYTYLIVNMTTHPEIQCDNIELFIEFMQFIFAPDVCSNISKSMSMVNVSPKIVDLIQSRVLQRITCRGFLVVNLIRQRKERNLAAQQKSNFFETVLPYIFGAFVLLMLLVIVAVAFRKKELKRNIERKSWTIPKDEFRMMAKLYVNDSTTSQYNFYGESWTGQNVISGSNLLLFGSVGKSKGQVSLSAFSERTSRKLHYFVNKISHENVVRFIGLSTNSNRKKLWHIFDATERGSLHIVLIETLFELDVNVKWSLANDMTSGLQYLHNRGIVHGLLDSWTCILGKNWTVKIANWSQNSLAKLEDSVCRMTNSGQGFESSANENQCQRLLFRHMDLMLNKSYYTAEVRHDIYSLGMIILEIYSNHLPYYSLFEELESWRRVLETVINTPTTFLPNIPAAIPFNISTLINDILENQYDSLNQITTKLQESAPSSSNGSVVDQMLVAMEKHVQEVKNKTNELKAISGQMESLLFNILPEEVVVALRSGDPVTPRHYSEVTVYFSDIVEFTNICAESSPLEVITMLNQLYTVIDRIIEQYDAYKVETIGDAYMIASGLPAPNGHNHVREIVRIAMKVNEATREFKIAQLPGRKIEKRIGVCSGAVMTGVVGMKMPRYCLFGDTVNVASRMESTGEPGRIHATQSSADLLEQYFCEEYKAIERDVIEVKGKGLMKTYWIESL